ncbi:MAG: hypothetical protein PHQ30_01165 [Candidatus Izemoplasmatales bacterium]|nr:hypothetical protein [Candidatus Izemoplasmatales bacterium]
MKLIFQKLILYLTLLLMALAVTGCVNNDRINIDAIGAQDFISISSDDLATLFDDDEDFVVLISNDLCLDCQTFDLILKEIITGYEICVYRIEEGDDFQTTNSLIPYNITPTFVIVSAGEIISQVNGYDQESIFASKTAFIDYLKDYVFID